VITLEQCFCLLQLAWPYLRSLQRAGDGLRGRIPIALPAHIVSSSTGRTFRKDESGGRPSALTSIATAPVFGSSIGAGTSTCEGSDLAPIQKFDASGHLVASFGSGMFEWPHGLFSASDGTVWVTDGKKQIVVQLAPDGRALRTLGKPGVAGDGPDEFNSPSDVLVAPNGDIFVADGHGDFPVPKTNDRIVKYSKDGKFIKAWGRHGSGQGEFDVPHGLAMDSAGRLFVADRANNRIQIFDQDGKFLAEWKQFGRPSGVYIRDDIIYVTDSQSNEKVNPPFRQGIRIGSVRDGKVTAFISAPDPNEEMPEGVAADKQGNVFGGFTQLPDLKKYVRN
jgi:DNA-binding beta-propeller fold protein YncE